MLLTRIRTVQPLIHNITNYVAMSFNANALLAIGASPIMAHAVEEMDAIVQLAQALVINIGTLDVNWLASMTQAMQAARKKSIPIIVDPVGAGASAFRTDAVLALMNNVSPDVIRGNASEIKALAGESLAESKGVDSLYASEAAYAAGKHVAERYQCTVVVSGAQDFIIHAEKTHVIENGVPLMSRVTGMGCTATALIGAFCAVESDYFLASTSAMLVMGVAGELAGLLSHGPGSFHMQFLDTLYTLKEEDITDRMKLTDYVR